MSVAFLEETQLVLECGKVVRNRLKEKSALYLKLAHFPRLEVLNIGEDVSIQLKTRSRFGHLHCCSWGKGRR